MLLCSLLWLRFGKYTKCVRSCSCVCSCVFVLLALAEVWKVHQECVLVRSQTLCTNSGPIMRLTSAFIQWDTLPPSQCILQYPGHYHGASMSKGDLPGLASPQDSGDLPGGWGRVQKPKSQHLAPNGVLPSLHFAKSFSFCQSRLFFKFF